MSAWANRKKKRLQQRNRRKLVVFDNCDFLPAWRFFKAFKDLRYLVDNPQLPEYDVTLLAPVWDKILLQYDEIEGSHLFEDMFADIGADCDEWDDIVILRAHYELLLLGYTERMNELEDFGIVISEKKITIELIQRVRSEIMKRYTRKEIEEVRESEKHKGKGDYYESVVQLGHILAPQIIDPMTITVTQYIELNKLAKKVIAAKTPKKEAWQQ